VVRGLRSTLAPGRDVTLLKHVVSGSLASKLIYEQVAHYLDMLDTATVTGSGPYTYSYEAPTTAAATPRSQTLVGGASDLVVGVVGAQAGGITLSWQYGEYVKLSVDLLGHSTEADALEALSEAASLTYATADQLTVYVDPFGGTLGATAFGGVSPSGALTINPQRHYKTGVGSLYPTDTYDDPGWEITGTLTLEETSVSAGWVDAILAGATKKLVRLLFTNGGATTAERSLTLDLAVEIKVGEIFTDADGLQTVDLTFSTIEESSQINGYFKAQLVNNTASIY
jgi:hypothetical protein